MESIQIQVADPSVAAILYQYEATRQLLLPVRGEELTSEARAVRSLIMLYADAARDRLYEIQSTAAHPLSSSNAGLVKVLAQTIRSAHETARYVSTDPSAACSRGVQGAISRLVVANWSAATGHDPSHAISLVTFVRGQWTYNYHYADLIELLQDELVGNATDLVEDIPLGEGEGQPSLTSVLWMGAQKAGHPAYAGPPVEAAALLSYPRADSRDILMSPMLVHELGHFMTLQRVPPVHQDRRIIPRELAQELGREGHVRTDSDRLAVEMRAELQREGLYEDRLHYGFDNALADAVTLERCLQEISADLTAVRMVGVAYFVALAEFLKTTANWPEPDVLESGYPGINLRLRVVWDELMTGGGMNARTMLEELLRDHENPALRRLLDYLLAWDTRLRAVEGATPSWSGFTNRSSSVRRAVLARHLRASLDGVKGLARRMVPVPVQLHPATAELVELIEAGEAPLPDSWTPTFADIIAAGWAYQLHAGDAEEAGLASLE